LLPLARVSRPPRRSFSGWHILTETQQRNPAMLIRIVLPAIALACAAFTPVAAQAKTLSVSVPYGDLDLTKDAGCRTLDARLERAARKVCGGIATSRDLSQLQNNRTCVTGARVAYQAPVELALNTAYARRVAVLADKIALLANF
jgi:UrcA family protein